MHEKGTPPMPMTIQRLLKEKGNKVYSIKPEATVLDAVRMMSDNNIGALLVMDADTLVGKISERDYARNVILKGRASSDTPIRDVMSKQVVCARPDQSVEECMAVMTDKSVRHLPVLENKKVIGIISIGDLVKSVIRDQKFVIEQLEHYLSA